MQAITRAIALILFVTLFMPATFARAENAPSLESVDLSAYDHLDPRAVVPDVPLKQALAYFDKNKDQFPNQSWLVVIDFTKHSSKDRFYLVNIQSGDVETYLTAHGRGLVYLRRTATRGHGRS